MKQQINTSRRQIVRHLLTLGLGVVFAPNPLVYAQSKEGPYWEKIVQSAQGQTVYFNAWGGSTAVNTYLQWVASQVKNTYQINLKHVKVQEIAHTVKRIRTEKKVGRDKKGTVDLVWINGENFAVMKREGLLFGPFAEQLPYFRYVDIQHKPSTILDFSIPTEGYESPWGMAQLTFMADSKKVDPYPQSMVDLLALAKKYPNQISYPSPPDFHGSTFIKQALIETTPDTSLLQQPYSAQAFYQATQPLWNYLDTLHPHLWRQGKQFVQNTNVMRQMMADGSLVLAFTLNPNEAANEIAAKRLPPSVKSWQFSTGTIGNTHFVGIPYNSQAKEAAQVVANFLLSPQAQARKADIAIWGDPTVLNINSLPAAEKRWFIQPPLAGQVEKASPVLLEPHASWTVPLKNAWSKRYAG
jgi:putative thiamine transport system substrate-binding protein